MHRKDPDAAAHRRRVVAAKLANCRRSAARVDEEAALAHPWTIESAADMLFAFVSSDMIEALLIDRRWSKRRLGDHLSAMFRATFVDQIRPRETALALAWWAGDDGGRLSGSYADGHRFPTRGLRLRPGPGSRTRPRAEEAKPWRRAVGVHER